MEFPPLISGSLEAILFELQGCTILMAKPLPVAAL
jgi:hypothetical protein